MDGKLDDSLENYYPNSQMSEEDNFPEGKFGGPCRAVSESCPIGFSVSALRKTGTQNSGPRPSKPPDVDLRRRALCAWLRYRSSAKG